MSDQSNEESDSIVHFDYTTDETREWRDPYETYRESQLFDSKEESSRTLITELRSQDITPQDDRMEAYINHLTAQFAYISEERGLTAWDGNTLEQLVTDVVEEVGPKEVFNLREELLHDLTESNTWGVERYTQLQEQLAVAIVDSIGVTTITEILDVRPHYQFERFAQPDPFSPPELIRVPSIPPSALDLLCESFNVSQQAVAKTALPFINELEQSILIDWYDRNRDNWEIAEIAEARWEEVRKSGFGLDIIEFTTALISTIDRRNRNSRHVRRLERKLRRELNPSSRSPHGLISALNRFTHLEKPELDLLIPVLESSSKNRTSPLYTQPPSTGAQAANSGAQGKPTHLSKNISQRRSSDTEKLTQISSRPEREKNETYLFIISRHGKPHEVTPKSVSPSQLEIDGVLSEYALDKDSLTAYAAPDTQQPAVKQMIRDDIILFFDGDNTYVTQYHVVDVVKAPDVVASLWPETESEDLRSATHPYLILMDSMLPRSIPQDSLNSLLGYASSSIPTRWKVSEDRIRNLTARGQPLEELLDRLDQSEDDA